MRNALAWRSYAFDPAGGWCSRGRRSLLCSASSPKQLVNVVAHTHASAIPARIEATITKAATRAYEVGMRRVCRLAVDLAIKAGRSVVLKSGHVASPRKGFPIVRAGGAAYIRPARHRTRSRRVRRCSVLRTLETREERISPWLAAGDKSPPAAAG
jgi:hypothetical protein